MPDNPDEQPSPPQTTQERRVIERIEAMQGQTFGAWTVLSGFELAPVNCTGGRFKRSKVNCQCGDCLRTKLVTITNLLAGRSQRCLSCAARKREQRSR